MRRVRISARSRQHQVHQAVQNVLTMGEHLSLVVIASGVAKGQHRVLRGDGRGCEGIGNRDLRLGNGKAWCRLASSR